MAPLLSTSVSRGVAAWYPNGECLLELGLHPGDRIGVLEDNSIGAQDFFAGAAAGGLCGCLSTPETVLTATTTFDHTGCRAVVVAGHYLDEIDAVRDRLPNLEHVIVRGDDYESWLAGFSADDPNVEISPTIGTSFATLVERPGSQKVLPIATGRGLLLDATGSTTFRRWRLATGAAVGPISHGSGYLYTPTWLSGGTNVMLDHFDPAETIEIMEREDLVHVCGAGNVECSGS